MGGGGHKKIIFLGIPEVDEEHCWEEERREEVGENNGQLACPRHHRFHSFYRAADIVRYRFAITASHHFGCTFAFLVEGVGLVRI